MAIKIELIRPDDLLNLRVEGVNLRLDADGPEGPALVVEDPGEPAHLIVTFPPQSIAESAYFMASVVPAATDTDYKRPDPDAAVATTLTEQPDPPGQAQSPRRTSAQLSRPSRLVFTVPAGARLPYSLEGLLDWSGLELKVSPVAALGREPTPAEIGNAPAIRQPAPNETALELPYRLLISPNREVAWGHRTGLLTTRGRTELWHTRLQLKTQEGPVELTSERRAPLRAIWSPDYNQNDPPPPARPDPDLVRTAMSPNDRHQIVILTSAFHGYEVDLELGAFQAQAGVVVGPGHLAHDQGLFVRAPLDAAKRFRAKVRVPYLPQPFEAEQLMLTPLGGWLNSRGQWDPPRKALPAVNPLLELDRIFARLPQGRLRPQDLLITRPVAANELIIQRPRPEEEILDLSEWVHVATQGRDHYVKIVYEGELLPFCHPAALIKVTERMFLERPGGVVGAYLVQHMFIVVRKPEVRFPDDDPAMPLKRVLLKTTKTPDIADPAPYIPGTDRSFWVKVMTAPAPSAPELFMFNATGFDVHNEPVDFSIPLMFVSKMDYEKDANLRKAASEYNDPSNFERRKAVVGGKKVWFAPSDPLRVTDNTRYITRTINFVVGPTGCPPKMLASDVNFPQVADLLGTDGAATIAFYDKYLAGGFDPQTNPTGVFARVVKPPDGSLKGGDPFAALADGALGVEFSSDKAGGFSTPNMSITTLTRAYGPVAGKIEDAAADKFDPGQFFKKGIARLFGSFDLADLFLKDSPLGQNAPKMQMETAGDKVVVRLEWQPAILDVGDPKVAAFRKDFRAPSVLDIKGRIEKPLKPGGAAAPPADDAQFEFTGRLTNFTVSVVNRSVTVNFAEFNFTARKNQKTDVQVKLDPDQPILFGGDLKFVEELRNAIPPGLFGTGPFLQLLDNPPGIRAGFAFALPPIAVGVFALKDVSLGAALTLPFLDGKPTFDFNVSERAHPFLLSVAIFGGGGFFHLQLDTAGIKLLEAAFEFGATAALDIGVASGEVHIMAGIYFAMQRKEPANVLVATLSGYLRLGGSLSVLGIVKISVEFVLSFTYDGGRDKAYGRATLTVQVEILFFSMSVELTVERAFGGSGDPKFGELMNTPEAWSEYALAFA